VLVRVSDLYAFLKRCAGHGIGFFDEVIVPVKRNGDYSWKRLNEETDFDLAGYRTIDPVKTLFYLARERVLNKSYKNTKRIIAGVKACDLKALDILDAALINEDFYDPSYKHWRENTVIITADCTDSLESCHCLLVDGQPWAESAFDVNISWLDDHCLLQSGSKQGEQLLRFVESHYPVDKDDASYHEKIKVQHEEMLRQLANRNQPFAYSEDPAGMKHIEPHIWKGESASCVGCAACTNICPTCYCLILNDESTDHTFVKVRSHDSCQLYGYARVAGGASPREGMSERFKNRYLCKYCFMPQNSGRLGCVGCGRCIDACPADIDYRSVMRDVLQNGSAQRQHEKSGEV